MSQIRTTANALIIRSLPAGIDTGKRLIKGQVATSYGKSHDNKWQYIVAPSGSGWASSSFLEVVHDTSLVSPLWPRVPNGRAGIVSVFGEPCRPACSRGIVILPEELVIGWERSQKIRRFLCHELMAPVFTSVFNTIYTRGLWHLLEDYGGCFNCRPIKEGQKDSTHSWGISIDLNMNKFPMGSTQRQDAQLMAIFADHGFINGTTWPRPDPMHFQYATGY